MPPHPSALLLRHSEPAILFASPLTAAQRHQTARAARRGAGGAAWGGVGRRAADAPVRRLFCRRAPARCPPHPPHPRALLLLLRAGRRG